MLFKEINGVGASDVKVRWHSSDGWTVYVPFEGIEHVFGPFKDEADADAIVAHVTRPAPEELPVERPSEFIEFVNGHMTRAAVRRESISSVQIVPPADYAVWAVKVDVGGVSILSQGFDSSSAADELFDRLTR